MRPTSRSSESDGASTTDVPGSRDDFNIAILCKSLSCFLDLSSILNPNWSAQLGLTHEEMNQACANYRLGVLEGHKVVIIWPTGETVDKCVLQKFRMLHRMFAVGVCGSMPFHPLTKEAVSLRDCIISAGWTRTITTPDLHPCYDAEHELKTPDLDFTMKDFLHRTKVLDCDNSTELWGERSDRSTRKVGSDYLSHYLDQCQSRSNTYQDALKEHLFKSSYVHGSCHMKSLGIGHATAKKSSQQNCADSGRHEKFLVPRRGRQEKPGSVHAPAVHFGYFLVDSDRFESGAERNNSNALLAFHSFTRAESSLVERLPTLMVMSPVYYVKRDRSVKWVKDGNAVAVAGLRAVLSTLNKAKEPGSTDEKLGYGVPDLRRPSPLPASNSDRNGRNICIQETGPGQNDSSDPMITGNPHNLGASNLTIESRWSATEYTIACIFPMGIEYTAGIAMLDERHENLPVRRDHNVYTLGRIGQHFVVLAAMPEAGINRATSVITQLLNDFPSIRFGLLVGIGGGIPSPIHDIRVGDIVVSKSTDTFGGVVQYDFGKEYQGKPFRRVGTLNKSSSLLQGSISKLSAMHNIDGPQILTILEQAMQGRPRMRAKFPRPSSSKDMLFNSIYVHQESVPIGNCSACDPLHIIERPARPDNLPVVHYGTIGSANTLMCNALHRDQLQKDMDILCVEMEAAGLMDEFPCLVIRGICDYADSHKNDTWQPHAAAVAAAYMKELLQTIPVKLVVSSRQATDAVDAG